MPSVAADSHQVLPNRAHAPGSRNQAADRNEPSTPFADLVDSAAPAAEPPSTPRPTRGRPERAERSDAPKAAGRDTEPKPAKDGASAKDSPTAGDAAKDAGDGKGAETNAADTSKSDKDGKAASVEKVKLEGDIAAATDNSDTAQAKDDPNAALAALIDATAPTPQATTAETKLAPAAPQSEVSDADEFAAAAAAGQAPRQGGGTGAKPADAEAGKPNASAAPASPDAATSDAQSGKSADTRDHADKPADFRHALAELAKGDSTPAQSGGDAGAAKTNTNGMQHFALTPAAHGAGASPASVNAAVAGASAQPQAAPVPLAGIAVEIATQAHAGNHRFEIRLDPPELGRIDVKLDVDRDGNVSTRLVVDRADTLDLLRRDAATLERALQQAGLKTGDHGLDFQLRQHAFAERDASSQNGGQPGSGDDEPAPVEAVRQNYGRMLGMGSGLDIRV